jgi:hypothetical protein
VLVADQLVAAGTHFNGESYGLLGLLLALLFAFACRAIAAKKGRHKFVWFVLGFLFHIISLIITALLPSKRVPRY